VIQLLAGYTAGARARRVEGGAEMAEMEEDLAGEIAPTVVPTADAPTCPNCFAALDETLAVKELETGPEGESYSVKIAYCNRCGAALGALP
jgi:hypothetical protein